MLKRLKPKASIMIHVVVKKKKILWNDGMCEKSSEEHYHDLCQDRAPSMLNAPCLKEATVKSLISHI